MYQSNGTQKKYFSLQKRSLALYRLTFICHSDTSDCYTIIEDDYYGYFFYIVRYKDIKIFIHRNKITLYKNLYTLQNKNINSIRKLKNEIK